MVVHFYEFPLFSPERSPARREIFEKTVDILRITEICTIALEIAWNKFQIRVHFYHYGSISIAEIPSTLRWNRPTGPLLSTRDGQIFLTKL